MPLLQQPVGQVMASQVAVPQPPSWQLSDAHVAQLAPPPPQLLGEVPGWQVPLESQHPLRQVALLHGGAAHVFCRQLPAPQLSHEMPPVPHARSVLPLRHTPLWQQPVGQVVASHLFSQT